MRTDEIASVFLQSYSQNIERNGIPLAEYAAIRGLSQANCERYGENCGSGFEIGFVVEQSQAPLLQVVSSALGVETRVQTFSSNGFDGAVVVTPDKVFDAIARATDYRFSDEVLTMVDFRAVPPPGAIPANLRSMSLRFDGDPGVFRHILDGHRRVSMIQQEMTPIYSALRPSDLGCNYGTTNDRAFVECFFHSTDFGVAIQEVWIRAFAILIVYRDNEYTHAFLAFDFSRAYGQIGQVPDAGDFLQADYGDVGEALLIRATMGRYETALLQVYQDAVEIRMDR